MTCPKCGSCAPMMGPLYRANYREMGERLVYVCRCGYETSTPTRDADPDVASLADALLRSARRPS